ncbi:hypothetical protein QZH41_001957 [Actinostola sp. cb2023]|nr:hypothetical protein QZH41_001957 [Actinostola sp. cb2023]
MASCSKRSRTTFTVEEVAKLCARDPENEDSDIDSSPGGMSSEEEVELDEELLNPSDFETELSYILFEIHRRANPGMDELKRPKKYSVLEFREELVRDLLGFVQYGNPPLYNKLPKEPPKADTFHTDHMVEFDKHMQIEWAKRVPEIRYKTPAGLSLNHILESLNKQLRMMNDPQFGHIVTRAKTTKTPERPTPLPRRHIPTMATSIAARSNPAQDRECLCCHKEHPLKKCDAFEKRAIEERWQLVKEKRLCHLCLDQGHMKVQCPSTEKCPCKATFAHHKFLHRDIHRKPAQEDQGRGLRVSLIIGQDVRVAHIVKEVKVSNDQEASGLHTTKTALGWTVAGPLEGKELEQREVDVNFTDQDTLLRERVDAFWTIENAGVDSDKTASVEDRRAENTLEQTTCFNNGHYETGLLWRADDPRLPNNKGVAETRLQRLRRKFRCDTEFEEKYRKVMEEYIERSYARKLSADEIKKISPKTNYLPHHGVINPNKPGKVRVVFDAAAKHEGASLNRKLLQGPDMTNNLTGVLMIFRQDKIALVADVEGMFHQVKVTPQDQDALRFLWWSGSLDEPPDEYLMTVHIFGATDSPCCSNYCLRKTALDHQGEYDAIVTNTVLRHFYVDDMLTALKNEELTISVERDLMSILAKGGFRLTKFMSNWPFPNRVGDWVRVTTASAIGAF